MSESLQNREAFSYLEFRRQRSVFKQLTSVCVYPTPRPSSVMIAAASPRRLGPGQFFFQTPESISQPRGRETKPWLYQTLAPLTWPPTHCPPPGILCQKGYIQSSASPQPPYVLLPTADLARAPEPFYLEESELDFKKLILLHKITPECGWQHLKLMGSRERKFFDF